MNCINFNSKVRYNRENKKHSEISNLKSKITNIIEINRCVLI